VSRAGFEPAAVLEWDRWACDTLAENKDWPIHRADVREFSYTKLRDIELVSGGPPANRFSMGGKHNAFLDRRDMFPEAIRAVRELRPRAFVFENVKGLTRATFANYLEYIRLQLRHPELLANDGEAWFGHLGRLERHETKGVHDGLHYNVILRLLNAANHGVPQKRERVFIVGFRSDLASNGISRRRHIPAKPCPGPRDPVATTGIATGWRARIGLRRRRRRVACPKPHRG